jgi:hypothetical protein
MIFEKGDKVTVVNELDFWTNVLTNEETTFTVADTSYAKHPCCAGHLQHLILVDSKGNVKHASASWFDPDLVGKPKVWCHGEHHLEDRDTYDGDDDIYEDETP